VSKVQRTFWQCVFTLREAAFAPAPPPQPAISVATAVDEGADEAVQGVEEEEEWEQNGYDIVELHTEDEEEEDDDVPVGGPMTPAGRGW
jgi:hypothetical protein